MICVFNIPFQSMFRIFLPLFFLVFSVCSLSAQQKKSYGMKSGAGSLWVGAGAGPSLMLETAADSLQPEIQDYFNQLRSGWHYGFETEYFFNNYVGIGAKYTTFKTKHEADSLVVEFFSSVFYIDLSNEMKINSVSPMIYGRLPLLKNKLSLTGGVGPAWLFYRNLGKTIGDSVTLKGSSPGLSTSLRVSYEVIPNLSLSIQGSYIYALLKGFTQDDGTTQQEITLEKANYQNISRIDLSFGIFYTFRRK
jgi:hypothetical protein